MHLRFRTSYLSIHGAIHLLVVEPSSLTKPEKVLCPTLDHGVPLGVRSDSLGRENLVCFSTSVFCGRQTDLTPRLER